MVSLKLTDLPIEVHSLIVDKLSDPIGLTLSYIRSLRPSSRLAICEKPFRESLPDDLLHAAQASPTLAKAVKYTIGPRVKSLSFYQTERLWEWIPILKGHLKAIDFGGIRLLPRLYGEVGLVAELPCTPVLEEYRSGGTTREQATFSTLQVLDSNEVQLEELDLSSVHIFNSEQARKMLVLLEKAIQRSSASLKKIHLNANQASLKAMENTILPRLVVFDVSIDPSRFLYGFDNLSRYNSDKALCQILKVVHTDAGTSCRSSVRELNLHALNIAPAVTFESCPGFFVGVKRLSLTFRDGSDQAGIATFIASFKNLESLTWTPNQEEICNVDNMKTIFTACHELKHINLTRKSPNRQSDVIGIPRSTAMNEFFRSFRGQLQTINLHYLTSEQINVLGENSPNLTSLYLSIDRETVKALPLLVGTHCRQLRELHLEYSRQDIFCFGKDSWSALSNAVRSTSPCFHTVSLIDGTQQTDRATLHMVGAIMDILEFMGDRAKKVWFKISMKSSSPLVVLKGVLRTLESAVVHCKSIRSLCLDFLPGYGRYNFTHNLSKSQDIKGSIIFWYRMVCKLQRSARSTLQYLEEFDVGSIDNVRLYFFDDLRCADRPSRFHSLH